MDTDTFEISAISRPGLCAMCARDCKAWHLTDEDCPQCNCSPDLYSTPADWEDLPF